MNSVMLAGVAMCLMGLRHITHTHSFTRLGGLKHNANTATLQGRLAQ